MKSVTSWLLNIAAIAFWVFRAGILICDSLQIDIPIKPMEAMVEIPIIFVTLFCLVLIFKRKLFGACLYLAIYAGYFGMDIINSMGNSSLSGEGKIFNIIIASFGILIALGNVIDIAIISKGKSTTKAVKETDWFYKNEKFDRELDERADKNQYRTQ